MRFVSIWRLSMPRAAMRRVAAEMAAARAIAAAASQPKEISLTDPQAAWVARKGVDPFFAYDANYLIDNRFGIILDADGTRANRSDEMAIAETMVDRVERRFDLKPERLAGDTAYGAAKLLKWLWDRGITPHVPVWDKSARSDGKFSRADFVFDRERNVYICPAGAELTHSGIVDQGRILPYRASTNDCSICKLKPRCTTAIARKVSRDIDEDVREHVRALANTEAFQLSCRERKKVEVRFAHMKRILKLDRLRLRGLSGVRDEVLLTATAQNFRRLAKLICRSPPQTASVRRKRKVASSVGAWVLRLRLPMAEPTQARDAYKQNRRQQTMRQPVLQHIRLEADVCQRQRFRLLKMVAGARFDRDLICHC